MASWSQSHPLPREALSEDSDSSTLLPVGVCFIPVCLGVLLFWLGFLVFCFVLFLFFFQTRSHLVQISFELTLVVESSCLCLVITGLGHRYSPTTLVIVPLIIKRQPGRQLYCAFASPQKLLFLFFLPRLEAVEQCPTEVVSLGVFCLSSPVTKMCAICVY